MTQVTIQNLDVSLSARSIIRQLNLTVHEGEFLVLLGPSGCGKSTLLHAIAGLNEVSAGSIRIGQQDMTDAEPSEREIGMVFQSYALYPTMSVAQNMSFGLKVRGVPKAQIESRIADVARLLQLEPLLQRKPGQLSGGQRQRVAIGRALMRDAKVFLFDEPLSNLDAKLRTELRRELKLLHQKLGSTMIYVTHDQIEAMTLATRIAVMRNGEIQQIGTPDDIYHQPQNLFVAGFLGSPAMNFFPGQLQYDSGLKQWSLADGAEGGLNLNLAGYRFAAEPVAGQKIVLGIRPEHIYVCHSGGWAAKLVFIEKMGSTSTAWLDFNGSRFSLILHDDPDWQTDQIIRFDIDRTRLTLFDQQSGHRI